MKALKPLFSVALIFLCISMTAQVDFSGTWNFNESQSKYGDGGGHDGPGGPMGGGSLVVIQNGNSLAVERTMHGPDGEMKISEKYTLDGNVCENTFIFDMKKKSTVTWSSDKKSISFESTMIMERDGESREMKESETWKLGADKKTLVIDSTRPNRDGDNMKMTMVYDKK
jgi:hypothetical protein